MYHRPLKRPSKPRSDEKQAPWSHHYFGKPMPSQATLNDFAKGVTRAVLHLAQEENDYDGRLDAAFNTLAIDDNLGNLGVVCLSAEVLSAVKSPLVQAAARCLAEMATSAARSTPVQRAVGVTLWARAVLSDDRLRAIAREVDESFNIDPLLSGRWIDYAGHNYTRSAERADRLRLRRAERDAELARRREASERDREALRALRAQWYADPVYQAKKREAMRAKQRAWYYARKAKEGITVKPRVASPTSPEVLQRRRELYQLKRDAAGLPTRAPRASPEERRRRRRELYRIKRDAAGLPRRKGHRTERLRSERPDREAALALRRAQYAADPERLARKAREAEQFERFRQGIHDWLFG